ncbi:MAG TPA: hypothetical protein VMZ69_10190, partial [Saprospiraceae bacterium]|nr:hypothetical protein [Saprospiraceae bacterium]
LAFEVCNEPHHRSTPEEVTEFVKKMKDAIKSTGTTKPVFYNVTHSIHLEDAYFNAGIDGGTFQWYPTGLGFQKELGGNMLPNVDRYEIPFDDVLKKNGAARFVYEFDAADMATAYMYPAMARSFRSAGMQLATHFSYDPTFLAPYNTEYNTHFMNLVYAPQKALSLMICAEVFRTIPLYSDYGVYPGNASFGPFRVSYEENLAEMVTDEKFIYTNHTSTKIKSPEKLTLIAGYGNSSLVQYNGSGAYFLDKLGEGLWRLELMPDAVIIDNLFGRNNQTTKRALIKYERRKMKINLPEFDHGFAIESVDWRDSVIYRETAKGEIALTPGVYLLMAPEYEQKDVVVLSSQKNMKLDEFFAPPSNTDNTYLSFTAPRTWSTSSEINVTPIILANINIDTAEVSFKSMAPEPSKYLYGLKRKQGFQYEGSIPQKHLQEGIMEYTITAHHQNNAPKGGRLTKQFGKSLANKIIIVEPKDSIVLFDAKLDSARLNRQWTRDAKMICPDPSMPSNLYIKLDGLARHDFENPNAPPIGDYSIRHYFGDLIEGRKKDISLKKTLVFSGNTPGKLSFPIQLSLVMKDGSAFGARIKLKQDQKQYSIPLKDLKRVQDVLLPRPYPTFLPYFSSAGKAKDLDLSQIESLQISVGPGIDKADWDKVYELLLESVWLE